MNNEKIRNWKDQIWVKPAGGVLVTDETERDERAGGGTTGGGEEEVWV